MVARRSSVGDGRDGALVTPARRGRAPSLCRMPEVITLCTGNAARSVMAGAILADLVPGIDVGTRGTAVIEGLVMSWRTRAALEGLGLRADDHRSRQLSADDLDGAGIVLAMAGEHVAYVRRTHPEAAARTVTLKRLVRDAATARPDRDPGSADDLGTLLAALELDTVALEPWEDIEDPVSGDVDQFHRCAAEIRDLLAQLVTFLGPALGAAATEARG
jgi:protein-tyrosine-phosphatase